MAKLHFFKFKNYQGKRKAVKVHGPYFSGVYIGFHCAYSFMDFMILLIWEGAQVIQGHFVKH